ncbi:inactive protein FON2 SPARE1-like [Aristolochia californica]|uniref:inactive protein FON2 SPARE1-like n=1 Tax=Aristolochia californica TaxID=171875 RepID=UPI0035D9308B
MKVFLLLLFAFLFLLLSATPAALSSYPSPLPDALARHRRHHNRRHHHHRHASSSPPQLPFCFRVMRNHRYPVHPPPPSSPDDEIDPRYGVQKRLVPSGPNPLHN